MTAARIKARICKDQDALDELAWFFNVDAYLPDVREPVAIDYGSVSTHAEALRIVLYVLTHRDQFDHSDLVHTPNVNQLTRED